MRKGKLYWNILYSYWCGEGWEISVCVRSFLFPAESNRLGWAKQCFKLGKGMLSPAYMFTLSWANSYLEGVMSIIGPHKLASCAEETLWRIFSYPMSQSKYRASTFSGRIARSLLRARLFRFMDDCTLMFKTTAISLWESFLM